VPLAAIVKVSPSLLSIRSFANRGQFLRRHHCVFLLFFFLLNFMTLILIETAH
jgi:hypothetical protein